MVVKQPIIEGSNPPLDFIIVKEKNQGGICMKEFLMIFAAVMIGLGIAKIVKFFVLKLLRKRKE